MALGIFIGQLAVPPIAGGPEGRSSEPLWRWENSGYQVTVRFSENGGMRSLRYGLMRANDSFLLAEEVLPPSLPAVVPSEILFAAKDDTTFAVFQFSTSDGSVSLLEFSVSGLKQLPIPTSDLPEYYSQSGRGNAFFFPLSMLKNTRHIRSDLTLTSVQRIKERWLVTMKIGKEQHVFYRADREALWHLQMDDEKDWLAKDPVLCGSRKITIDGEEKTVQLWNQIAERQNVEQQLASYKIPDINFTWVDIVDADGSTRRIWEAPADDVTFGTVPESGFLACFIEQNRRIAFAFCDRFGPAEYYEADEKLDLPKSNVIPRTQMYIQRTDGIGSWPAIPRFGRNMIGDLAYMAFHKPDETSRIQLLTLSRVDDRMRLEVGFQEQKVVFDLADDAPQWQQRADLLRPLNQEK